MLGEPLTAISYAPIPVAPRITPDLEIRRKPPALWYDTIVPQSFGRRGTASDGLQTLPSPNTFRTRDMLSLVANALAAEQVIRMHGSGTTNPSKFFWEAHLRSRAKT